MRNFILPLAAILGTPLVAHADPPDETTPVTSVVVTATRLPSELADEPDVRVIDRTAIDLRQATFAGDLLTTVPGVAFTQAGAFGGVASVRMRGASSDKTLVLIDGAPQNDASQPAGAYDFSALDLADIERVEILSGPQSSLWGSDAIGGVIAFTTRELDGWRAGFEGGSLNTFDGSAGVGRRTDQWALGASISGYRSDGVSKADGLGTPDPFWNWTAGGYGRLTLSPAVSLDARVRYDRWRTEIDGYDASTFAFGDTPGQTYFGDTWTGTVRAQVDGPWGFHDTVSVGLFAIDRTDNYPGHPEDSSSYTAQRQDYRWLAQRGAPSDALGLAFGVEREADRASLSTGQHLDLGTTSGFGVVRWRAWTPLTLTGALRYDAPDSFGGQATGRAAAVLKLTAGFSLEAAWGQGFKTPTISELACDFCDVGAATPLKPEHAESWDVALAWRSSDGRFTGKLTGYRLAVRDQIVFTTLPPFHYVNLARTKSEGLEAEFDARLTPQLTAQAEYAYTDARDLDPDSPSLRVPRNAGSVSLLWSQGRWNGALTVRSEGPDADVNPITFEEPVTRPGFTLVNLSGAYALRPGLELTARIENLADTHYQEVLGYGEPRRMVLIGLRAKG